MSAGGYVDACGFIPASSGTGDFVVSVAVTGYQTPASAGAVNATVYSYRAESSDKSQWEEGFGAYTVGSTTLARTTITANSSGGASAINFSAAPNVFITAASADLQNASLLTGGTIPAARITFAVKADQTTATSTTVPVNPAIQHNHPSAAKVYGKVTVSGGAITASTLYGCTVARTSTGIYTVTFTTAFTTAGYTALAGCWGDRDRNAQPRTFNTGTLTIEVFSPGTSNLGDFSFSFVIFGTQ